MYTKELWELVFEGGDGAGTITIRATSQEAIAGEPLFADYRGAIVAQCTAIPGRDDSAARVLANARLIAQAPTLLAALEPLDRVAHSLGDIPEHWAREKRFAWYETDDDGDDTLTLAELMAAIAAIAQAKPEGEGK